MPAPLQETQWLCQLMPLPHEISIRNQVVLHPQEISIKAAPGAGDLERQAAFELEQLFRQKAGAVPAGAGFSILLGVVVQGRVDGVPVERAGRLAELPNNEQAYTIQPQGAQRLVLAALDPRGVYYAARTLCQLLEPFLTPEEISIPLATVWDWPDMGERGLWNFPQPAEWIPWLSSLKLNYGKMADTRLQPVERGKQNRAAIDGELLREGRRRAFNYVPYILHLNFLHDIGLFRAYPELAGQGDGALSGRYFAHKQGSQHRVPCAANPLLAQLLAEWMADLADQGAGEVSCWLSERPAQCGCKACTAAGQLVLEARAFVEAWRTVQQRHPRFQIRIFLSTTTTDKNYRILAELPPEVKVERACATSMERVLQLPRDLLANPLLDHCASQGRWLASYDVPLTANACVDTPEFKVPESSAHRVRDCVRQLAQRRYHGVYGMMAWATHTRQICGFNICALAEWSWNLDGRSEREFAVAWATRAGHAAPEQVGEWAELMGPVEFDVYDSDFPVCYSWGKAIALVRERRRPYLGEGMFRYYTSPEDFERKLAICARALEIAGQFADPYLAHETGVVMSYVRLAQRIFQVAELLATADLALLETQGRLRAALAQLERAGAENGAAIEAWRGLLGPAPWHWRVHDALDATRTTVAEICRWVSERYLY